MMRRESHGGDPGHILILNGSSSSGKTSLARALQTQLRQPHHHLQLDAFRSMEPTGYWDGWQEQGTAASDRQHAALCHAMNAALREYALHGQPIIFDTVLSNPVAWRHLLDDLADLPVYLVGVTCQSGELLRREHARGDREIGLAARQFPSIHADKTYDLMIDTTARSADSCAADVVRWFDGQPTPFAFKAMQAAQEVAQKVAPVRETASGF